MKTTLVIIIAAFLSMSCQGNGLVDGTIEDPNQLIDNDKINDKDPTIIDKDGKETKVDPEVIEKLATKCETRPEKLDGVPLRVLTTNEINLNLAKLFPNLELEYVDMSGRDTKVGHRFVRNSQENITSAHVVEFRKMAEAVATQVHDEVEKVADCTNGNVDEIQCIRDSIEEITTTAFRRPLEAGELDKYVALYNIGDEINHREGMRYVVEMTLQSPSFMYIFEEDNAEARQLSGREIAQHMSSMFTQTLPDADLLAAAEDGTLFTNAGRIEQATRLIESELGQQTVKTIVSQWFGLSEIGNSPLADLDSGIISGAELESQQMISEIVEDGADWTKLLTSDYTIVNPIMAAHYGINISAAEDLGNNWFKVKTDYSAGLLTQSSFLAVNGTRSVHRGHNVWTDLLCGTVPGAPGEIIAPETFEGESDRSKQEKRMAENDCGFCHAQMEPHGIALDLFDSVGRRLTEDQFGNPLTNDGQLMNADGTFVDIIGAKGLGKELAERKEARACVAKHMFTWAFARPKTSADSCEIFDIEHALLTNNDNLKQALIQVVASDEFIQR